MEGTAASDGFIIGMGKDHEHATKLLCILQRNREIRGCQQARYPKEGDDERHNQKEYHYCFLNVLLEYPGDEPPGMLHIFDVWLADGLDKRLLFNMHAVQVAGEHAREQGDQAGPV